MIRSSVRSLAWLALVAAAPGVAQTLRSIPKAKLGTTPPPATGRQPGSIAGPSTPAHAATKMAGATTQVLRVRYLTDVNTPVTLAAEGVTFACGPDPRDDPTPVTLCTAQTDRAQVDLSASYGKGTPLAPVTPQVSGNQWREACAGTTGTVCRIDMTGPRTVGIDYYAKP